MNFMYLQLSLTAVLASILILMVRMTEGAPTHHELAAIHSGFGHHGHSPVAAAPGFGPRPFSAAVGPIPNFKPAKREINDTRRRKFFWVTYWNENLKPLLRILGDMGKLRLKEHTVALTETLQEDLSNQQ